MKFFIGTLELLLMTFLGVVVLSFLATIGFPALVVILLIIIACK